MPPEIESRRNTARPVRHVSLLSKTHALSTKYCLLPRYLGKWQILGGLTLNFLRSAQGKESEVCTETDATNPK